ncbi:MULTISPECIES: SDR family NAD(P)-dependent oxidoreductase [Pseudonocardia]|uniref:2-(R)-hydroxypropyl-CoM dehydrogenase n=2 Tax=Pseudonocardia TaxID=1847 RepID=A0A1Y2MZZ9_PSEAH|nr:MULTISPECIES: SDR family NAD(P)-dependent oxidoreductase [Pseudonocardia]OSY40765.1 2-(R)-hydroxypropyl-CoM dehydrogenase [Pseudonocardia autotrophica]TDN71928.1 3-oxoacyl-[acyl-carrier protein] reductase [Pseudonocardia autotrophica]BBG02615.1 short-chain dehydrogenase/reductase SDR [Pseudonocardia autotrophica]GEC24674.1 short-chain dehydrogenase/reductase SDR [Pseudonocardia saturnea]
MQRNEIDLSGRVAVVTGGASGIGLAVTRRFLGSAAQVAVWDVGDVPSDLPGEVLRDRVDVTDLAAVEAATARVVDRLGGVDILVNAAGIADGTWVVQDYPPETWHRELAVNLTGVFHTCRTAIPHMLAGGYGRIVNVSSMAAKDGSPNQAGYVASKAGVLALTRTIAREVAEANIAVNAVTPTLFDTPLFRDWESRTPPEVSQWAASRVPMKRIGRPDEAAAMIAWMASEECSFTTGMTFDLSGGRAVW